MKFLVVLAVALACAAAADLSKGDATVPITRQTFDISPEGVFEYSYETGNGIAAQVTGTLENSETGPSEKLVGGYKYTAPDGSGHETIYVADKEGYKPVSADIPTPPPVPEQILRALAWIADHPPQPVRP